MKDCSFQCKYNLFSLAKGLFKISNLYNFFHGCLSKEKNCRLGLHASTVRNSFLYYQFLSNPNKLLNFSLPFDLCISAKLAMNSKEALSTFWLPWSFLVDSSVGL